MLFICNVTYFSNYYKSRIISNIKVFEIPSPFVHGMNHLLLYLFIIDPSHPGSHDMHCAKKIHTPVRHCEVPEKPS